MQGQAQKAQADQQAAELRQNALYLNNAARDAERRGAIESDWQRVSTQAAIGSQRVAQAGSGGVVDQDSYGIMTQDTAQLGELDALTISNNAAREAYGYKVQASSLTTNAANLQSQAKRGMMTSILGGAAQGFGAGGGFSAFGGGASSAGSVNLQGQARPLTNNSAYVSRM
jgi:hypothetical protein